MVIDNRTTIYVDFGVCNGTCLFQYVLRESFPEVKETKIYVNQYFPEYTAEDIEADNISVFKIDGESVSDVVKVTSTSQEGYVSMIIVEFDEDVPVESALQK